MFILKQLYYICISEEVILWKHCHKYKCMMVVVINDQLHKAQ